MKNGTLTEPKLEQRVCEVSAELDRQKKINMKKIALKLS